MKYLFLILIILISVNLNAQIMNAPEDIVTKLFIASDSKDWDTVENSFTSSVLLDYSSMTGSPATELSPEQITASWKAILPGFESTHHQIGNILTKINGTEATVFCYGTASHFLPDEHGSIWTVVGSYDFILNKNSQGSWKISSMKFNFRYQDGNSALAEKAINNLK